MSASDFISVVMPAFNHERYVGEAVDSVRDQSLAPGELVVVDDGSTDGTPDVLERHRFDALRSVRQANLGAHEALNRAVSLSRGDWIAVLNSDDAFAPTRLEEAVGVACATGAALLLGRVRLIDDGGAPLDPAHPTARWYAEVMSDRRGSASVSEAAERHNFAVTTSNFFFHRELWRSLGGFAPWRYVHDYDFLLRALALCPDKVVYEDSLAGVDYRVHEENTITEDVDAALAEREAMLRERSRPARRLSGVLRRASGARGVRQAVDSSGRAGASTQAVRHAGEPLRCGILVRDLDEGGLEEVVALLARTLPWEGVEPHVLCTQRGGRVAERLLRAGVPVEVAPDRRARERWQERTRPDVLSSHFVDTDVLEELSGYGAPLVDTVHNTYAWFSPDDWASEAEKQPLLAGRVAVSEMAGQYYLRHGPRAGAPFRVIPNAVDPTRVRVVPRAFARTRLGIDAEVHVFVQLGRLTRQKNQSGLLEAFAEVARAEPRALLILAGGQDAKYVAELRDAHGPLLTGGQVRLEPSLDDVGVLLSAADTCVANSFFEGWSVAASEALWAGLPLITSECGASRELVGSASERGWVVPNPAGDPLGLTPGLVEAPARAALESNRDALVHAMLDALHDGPTWSSRKDEIRSFARGLLDPKRLAASYAEVFRSAMVVLATAFGLMPGGASGQTTPMLDPGAQDSAAPEICPLGRISEIRVANGSVFDAQAADAAFLRIAYRTLNLVHVRTSPQFIRGELLFAEGDCFDPFLLSESERLLDTYGFLTQARVSAADGALGEKRVLVETRDEWSTKVDLGVTYDEGLNLERFQATEENFLGRGAFAEFTFRERREQKSHAFGVATPRAFGRADASLSWGRDRAGRFFAESVRYPFVGETGRFSLQEAFSRTTVYLPYATGDAEGPSHLLVPVSSERLEFSGARRFGPPAGSLIVGLSLARDLVEFPRAPEYALHGDFDAREPADGSLPSQVFRQLDPRAATRVALHLGTRRFTYREYQGLDAVRDVQTVGLGFFAGLSAGVGLDLWAPSWAPAADDYFVRTHLSGGVPLGSSLLHAGVTGEASHDGAWRDVLAEGDIAAYGRAGWLPGQTIFVRLSGAGGWRTSLPYQLTLGGRDGVRSLLEDDLPGGRLARAVLEDRIVLPRPRWDAMDLGVTLFADAGRIWAGDVPYGTSSGWHGALGAGLRLAFPSGSRNAWRADMVFPVGSAGEGPVFRVTLELNRIRSGFFTNELQRSRRFNLGAETF